MLRRRLILRLLVLMLMVLGGRDRRCSVHRASPIIRYQADALKCNSFMQLTSTDFEMQGTWTQKFKCFSCDLMQLSHFNMK